MTLDPDRLTADLRQHEREQDAAQLEDERTKNDRIEAAHETIRDSKRLRTMLNDESLAAPLTALIRRLPEVGHEIARLRSEHRVAPEEISAIIRSAQQLAVVERLLLAMVLEDTR